MLLVCSQLESLNSIQTCPRVLFYLHGGLWHHGNGVCWTCFAWRRPKSSFSSRRQTQISPGWLLMQTDSILICVNNGCFPWVKMLEYMKVGPWCCSSFQGSVVVSMLAGAEDFFRPPFRKVRSTLLYTYQCVPSRNTYLEGQRKEMQQQTNATLESLLLPSFDKPINHWELRWSRWFIQLLQQCFTHIYSSFYSNSHADNTEIYMLNCQCFRTFFSSWLINV